MEFREDTDNTERKKRSREGQGTWGPGRPGMGKEEVGTQVAPSSRDGPLGGVSPHVILRDNHTTPVTKTTLLGPLWLILGFGKGKNSGDTMLGATVEQRHQNFLQRIYYLELKIYIYISTSFFFFKSQKDSNSVGFL